MAGRQPSSRSFGTIAAVVVSHDPPRAFTENIAAVLPHVQFAVIVDNGSSAETQAMLASLAANNSDKLDVILNRDNRGLAAAQNQGIAHVLKRNAEWTLLLDDDSLPAPEMTQQLQQAYLDHAAKERIALLSPAIRDTNTGRVARYVLPRFGPFFARKSFGEQKILEPFAVIASGSLIKTSVLREMGTFREEFFIDYVDTEFCLRLISRGWKIVAVRQAILNHQLGAKTAHRFLCFTLIASNHSPERRFTIYRNRVAVWKRYLFRTPGYICYDVLAAFWDLFRILLLEQRKTEKLGAALKGLAIGILR